MGSYELIQNVGLMLLNAKLSQLAGGSGLIFNIQI